MPNTLTEIAGAGVTFDRYYVSDPLCCPSRATLLTGQYAHNDGVLGNGPGAFGGYGALDKQNNLAVWLRDAGYRTIHIGKFLNYYGQPPVSAPTEVPPGWSDWETLVGEDSTHYFYGYRLNVNGAVEGPFGDITYAHRDPGGCPDDPPPGQACDYQTDVLNQRAVDQIAASAGHGPFFLSLDYVAPHGDFRPPWGAEPAPRDYDSWATAPLPRPPGFNERNVSDKPRFLRRSHRLSPPQIAHAQQEYQKGIESLRSVDAGVGRIFAALAATGQLSNTFVFFTTDNGFFQGEHRIQRSKFLPYEPSNHVPLFLRGPGIDAGTRSGELVANVDIAPTILQIAGAASEHCGRRPLAAPLRPQAGAANRSAAAARGVHARRRRGDGAQGGVDVDPRRAGARLPGHSGRALQVRPLRRRSEGALRPRARPPRASLAGQRPPLPARPGVPGPAPEPAAALQRPGLPQVATGANSEADLQTTPAPLPRAPPPRAALGR